MAHLVRLYSKEGCCLCSEAKDLLLKLSPRYDLEVQEVYITSDEALFEKYKYLIPVIEIGGEVGLAGRIEEESLRDVLAARLRNGSS